MSDDSFLPCDSLMYRKCDAVTVNRKGKSVSALAILDLLVPWKSHEGFLCFCIILTFVLLGDHEDISLTLKAWSAFMIWLFSLGINDYYTHYYPFITIKAPSSGQKQHSHVNHDHITVVECEFTMDTLKLINTLQEEKESRPLSSVQVEEVPNPVSVTPTRMVFQVNILSKSRRWKIWKRYEEFVYLYCMLVEKHSHNNNEDNHKQQTTQQQLLDNSNHSLQNGQQQRTSFNTTVPKLRSYVKVWKQYHIAYKQQQQQNKQTINNNKNNNSINNGNTLAVGSNTPNGNSSHSNSHSMMGMMTRTSMESLWSLKQQQQQQPVGSFSSYSQQQHQQQQQQSSTQNKYDRYLYDPAFQALLQGELLAWLNAIRTNFALSEDELIRYFLGITAGYNILPTADQQRGEEEEEDGIAASYHQQELHMAEEEDYDGGRLGGNSSSNRSNNRWIPLSIGGSSSLDGQQQRVNDNSVGGYQYLLTRERLPKLALATTTTTDTALAASSPATSSATASNSHSTQPANVATSSSSSAKAPETGSSTRYGPISYAGTTWSSFHFTDQPPSVQAMTRDCRYSHGFKVRSSSYLTDRKKMEAGPAIGQFIHMDTFPVPTAAQILAQTQTILTQTQNTQTTTQNTHNLGYTTQNTQSLGNCAQNLGNLYGDRYDHIARQPYVAERIRIIRRVLADPVTGNSPNLFLLNFQIPGDPPYCSVCYIAIPAEYHSDIAGSRDLQVAKRMYEQFVEGIPMSDTWDYGSSDSEGEDDIEEEGDGQCEGEQQQQKQQAKQQQLKSNGIAAAVDGDLQHQLLDKKRNGQSAIVTAATVDTNNNSKLLPPLANKKKPTRRETVYIQEVEEDGEFDITIHHSDSSHQLAAIAVATSIAAEEEDEQDAAKDKKTKQVKVVGEARVIARSRSNGHQPTTAIAAAANKELADEEDKADDKKQTKTTKEKKKTKTKKVPIDLASLKALNPPKVWNSDITWGTVGEPGILERNSFNNKRFKLIPAMVEAPWILQAAVSSTPVLLGTKLCQRYYRGEGYIEIDLHVGSSGIANQIVGLCRTYSKNFVANTGVVIQGEVEDELPERLLFCLTLSKMDLVEMAKCTKDAVMIHHLVARQEAKKTAKKQQPKSKV